MIEILSWWHFLRKSRYDMGMTNSQRSLSAYIGAKQGKWFETFIEGELRRHGWLVLPIEDGCRVLGPGGIKFERVTQPFDFVAVGPERQVLFFDAKARSGAQHVIPSWLKGGFKRDKRGRVFPDSTMRQLKWLQDIQRMGQRAGFVVLVQDTKQIFWVPALGADVDPMQRAALWGRVGEPLKIRFGASESAGPARIE